MKLSSMHYSGLSLAAKNLRFGYVTVLGFTNCRGVYLLARFINYYEQYNAYSSVLGCKKLRSYVGS